MNRPAPISVFSDQHRTKSTTRSRTSGGTHTLVRAPQDFFLKRCVRPSIRPTSRLWSGSSSPGTRSVAVRLDGPVGSCQRRPQRHSRRTLFANDRIPLAAAPVHHTDRKPALYPTSAASGWQPSLPRCSAFALFSCVLSAILTEERPLQFQLRQDKSLSLSVSRGAFTALFYLVFAGDSLVFIQIAFTHWLFVLWTCNFRERC